MRTPWCVRMVLVQDRPASTLAHNLLSRKKNFGLIYVKSEIAQRHIANCRANPCARRLAVCERRCVLVHFVAGDSSTRINIVSALWANAIIYTSRTTLSLPRRRAARRSKASIRAPEHPLKFSLPQPSLVVIFDIVNHVNINSTLGVAVPHEKNGNAFHVNMSL